MHILLSYNKLISKYNRESKGKNARASYGVFGWWMELALYILVEGMQVEWNHILEKVFSEVK